MTWELFEKISTFVMPILIFTPPYLAYRKGRNPWLWLAYSILIPFVPLLHSLALGPLVKCPICHKEIDGNHKTCHYCHTAFLVNAKDGRVRNE